ncbi:MAG TPA: endolytic transglycosylase MltG [Aliidiomarina sp.]|nr:endolytic transglycosylase MltG [Aliidiomarina sp.]
MLKFLRNVIIAVITSGFAAVFAGYFWLQHWYETTHLHVAPENSSQLVEVVRGSHGRSVALLLAEQGFIETPQLAYWAARLFTDAQHLQAGVYAVTANDTISGLWQKIGRGEQHYFSITFAEGLNFAEWREHIAEHPWLKAEWQDLTPQQVAHSLAPNKNYPLPEGLLFPDTYRFHAYTSDRQIYQQAYRRMQGVLDELWASRADNLPVASPYEALVLASIIEKETGAAHERGLVASVFTNRLVKGMRLQSDPTIVYGLGERYRGVIYRSDINETTAYNTYRINGLPPTPIAMPGREAIAATLQPETTGYLYFVSQNDGTHVFSKTLQEHNRAVQQYQRNK